MIALTRICFFVIVISVTIKIVPGNALVADDDGTLINADDDITMLVGQ